MVAGMWGRSQTAYMAGLQEKAKVLALKSREKTTTNKYWYAFQRFNDWMKLNLQEVIFPAEGKTVGLYLTHLAEEKSPSVVFWHSTFPGIRHFHLLNGMSDPTLHPLPNLILEAVKRSKGKPVVGKLPVTMEIMRNLYGKLFRENTNQREIRFLTFAFLSFYGFLRFSEVASIKRKCLQFSDTHFSIQIIKSKTDVYSSGNKVVIANSTSDICPARLLHRYLDKSGIVEGEYFIFRNIS